MGSFMNSSKPFSAFAKKAETYLADRFPEILDKNGVQSIHIGRNKDASSGDRGAYRITGAQAQTRGNYMEVPDNILPDGMIRNEGARQKTFETRVSDSARNYILDEVDKLVKSGVAEGEARKRIKDSIPVVTYFDTKAGIYVAEPVIARVNDSMISSLSVPYWNVSYTNKVFKQPFIEGIAKNLVNTIGVPNVWADALVMYAETFEGMARLSNTAHGTVEPNASATVSNRMDMLVSDFVNIVIDYETGMQEGIMGAQNGNPLTSMAMGDRERYARLMISQMSNALTLFGSAESGFNGLAQTVSEDAWVGSSLQTIWAGASAQKGADAVKSLLKIIGDMQEALSFLPTTVRINVSPTAYKVLKWTMQSDLYNQASPLKILENGFYDTSKITSNGFIKGIDDFVLVADPFCAAQTPWNPNSTDLTFITFPSVKSALDPMDGLVMQPVAIENYILPSYPQRDGLLRTMLKRQGSVIAPVTGTVKVIRGMGI